MTAFLRIDLDAEDEMPREERSHTHRFVLSRTFSSAQVHPNGE
jgi:hypothetical protein